MMSFLAIVQSTIKELLRDRIMYVLIFFGCLLILLSLLLSSLSVQENLRLTIDFGLSGIHMIMQVIAVFIGSTIVVREIEKKSILFVMSYPISRTTYLLGKMTGFSFLLLAILSGMYLLLTLLLFQLGWSFHESIIASYWGVFLESVLLLSLTMGLCALMKPMSVVIVCVGVFLAGHSLNSFKEIASKSKNDFMKFMSDFFEYVIPNLENMNWRSHVVYADSIVFFDILKTTAYCALWCTFFLVMAISFFRRKDFV